MTVVHEAAAAPEPGTLSPLATTFAAQRAAFDRGAPSYDRRVDALLALRDAIREHEQALVDAVSADFGGRAFEETRLLELVPLLDLIGHARRHLESWMRPRRVRGTWFLLPARAYVLPQPLGVVGVIGAWNYPLLLMLGPLVDAIAAGNHVMLKPSELVPHTSTLLAEILAARFQSDYVAVVNGGRDLGEAFAALPFDHLVFTGSTAVGSLVMRAASANLTPVTLELGGKSPVIVHADYPLEKALRRILQGKLYNAGQTCIAPDYVLVPAGSEAEVEERAKRIVAEFYPRLVDNSDYTRILSRPLYDRLQAALSEAAARGARIVSINPGGERCSAENKVLPPTLVFGAPPDSELMRTEIFGPVLPVIPYASIAEAIAFVNARPRPLALYYFDNNKTRIEYITTATISGGVTVNDVLYHIGQHELPFGGVGPSGMGHYHGRHGFERFSKMKGVMVQGRFAPTRFFAPPYTRRIRTLIARLLGFAAR